jgi:CubicO group peptidase (beta-lactamase class C family)
MFERAAIFVWICIHLFVGLLDKSPLTVSAQEATEELRAERQQFLTQELLTSRTGGWIFVPGLHPRFVWRDVDEVRRLGHDPKFTTRWFDASLREASQPDAPGRWMAWLEGVAPNGMPWRRAFTLYAIPPITNSEFAPDLTVHFSNFPGKNAPAAWLEHRNEFERFAKDLMTRGLIDSELGAILVAGTAESAELGRPKRFVEWATSVNDEFQLKLKLKLLGLDEKVKTLRQPILNEQPSLTIRDGEPVEAGVPATAKRAIDEFCREWAAATDEPFVTLVAKRGVIITHEAFGRTAQGEPVELDYRCWAASITKTVTAILFSQFVDQKLIGLDDQLDRVFPDFPINNPAVPTFRQLLNHTSGLSGHGEYGGMRNPHLENFVLNVIDINQPGQRHEYCGLGFELAVKAMEIVSGKSGPRLFHEHLFEPLGFGDVIMRNASSDGEFTALELAILGQWIANEGSYGTLRFIGPATWAEFLPHPLAVPGVKEEQGLGIHRVRHRRPDASLQSTRPEDQLFSEHTVGHGSFSGGILVVDPDQQLVIVQVRQRFSESDNEWYPRFFQKIAAEISFPK